ncbi:MAG: DUF6268 family outer membrane beta-barrel protein [Desulfobacterales bacterium]|nr:DUF6268 family outer membrane beta-barrel protein [Desulfobacterales bacterium]
MQKKYSFVFFYFFLLFLLGLTLNVSPAASQSENKLIDINWSFSAAPIFQSESDLDRGGKFSLNHYQVRWAATKSVSDSTRLGFSIGYDYLDFDFSGTIAFSGTEPWREVHRISFALPVYYRADEDWQLFITPSINFSGESDADFSESLRYGVVATATYRFSPDFSFGAGLGIFQGLEETNVFPFLAVYWKIGEKWLMANPFSAGPIGPAGLEVTYSPSDLWELGGGGAFRSSRFRLDNDGSAPDGIGESSGLPVWIRITRKFSRQYKLDFYGGVLLNGELRIEDRSGRKLGSDDFDPAAFMAVNISARF